jgi:hypothetical protein
MKSSTFLFVQLGVLGVEGFLQLGDAEHGAPALLRRLRRLRQHRSLHATSSMRAVFSARSV